MDVAVTTMNIAITIAIAIFAGTWAVATYFLNNFRDDRRAKRSAAKDFLTKVNICIRKIEGGEICITDEKNFPDCKSNKHVVCISSYTAYRMLLKGNKARKFDECWCNYQNLIKDKTNDNNKTKEALECLRDIVLSEVDAAINNHEACKSCGAKSKEGRIKRFSQNTQTK